jgi:hypothetical protein
MRDDGEPGSKKCVAGNAPCEVGVATTINHPNKKSRCIRTYPVDFILTQTCSSVQPLALNHVLSQRLFVCMKE